jgi:curved DNA-binding protein CbpA
MQTARAGRQQAEQRVPRLAPGWERCGLTLSPAEGFLLSRIDGATPWALLREIGGLAPKEADSCLERWVAAGLVIVSGSEAAAQHPPSPATKSSPAGRGTAPAPAIDESLLDPSLQIPVDAQRRVLAFEATLERPYHELLGVGHGVDAKAIKRAYFQLSKEYHPDRYYGRRIGPYAARLDHIFKKIVEAYELLMDPTTRAELERSMASRAPEPAPAEPEAPAAEQPAQAEPARAKAPPPSAGRRALERLHRQFKIPDALLAERRGRAREFHAASLIALKKQRWLEAAGSSRLAIAFDPWNEDYKKRFGEVQAKVNEMRANELLERANASLDHSAAPEALRLFEDVLLYKPHDPVVNARAAELSLEIGDRARAREYAERACELRGDVAEYQCTLGRVLVREGLRDKAITAFERALAIEPKNKKAADELRRLRLRRAGGGKR